MEIGAVLRALNSALDAAKKARDLLPASARSAVDAEIDRAEEQFQMARAQIAKDLGYKLCRCKFPPGIMLVLHKERCYKCDACGNVVSFDEGKPIGVSSHRDRMPNW